MAVFPLPKRPTLSYKTGNRYFGAGNRGTRKHAACDLITAKDTEVYAVEYGTVIRTTNNFHHGAGAVEVRHGKFVIRYGEIKPVAGLSMSSVVQEGQVIGHVQKMHKDSMLHFEMYSGSSTGPLTDRSNSPYQRRSDLIDPTPYLDSWPLKTTAGQ